MASTISEEEIQQLLRTVEMFEAITQSQPDDYQSWEILKEAYTKLGRQEDSRRASKKLAEAYISLGQFSQAILEYEGILQEHPNDPDVLKALSELEAKTSGFNLAAASGTPALSEDSKPTPPAPTLAVGAGASQSSHASRKPEDGDRALANMLLAEKFVTPQAVEPLLQRLTAQRPASIEKGQPLTLVQMLVDEQITKLEDILTLLVDKSGLAYLPLSIYDVDRDVACLLPKDFCFAHCIIAFDLISRSLLIATANPFDVVARNQAELIAGYSVFWYLASPAEIISALRRVHGLDSKTAPGARPKANQ